MENKDSMASILDDADKVFCFEQDCRPQERAHRYLTEKQVNRGFNDTAMLCVVNDLVKRAHALGFGEGCDKGREEAAEEAGDGLARALLYKCGGQLLEAAEQMGGR